MIVLYRPNENKIIWHKKFPWIQQHDVDILNDHQISIYNNKRPIFTFDKTDEKYSNNLLIYDFAKDQVLNNYESLFKKYDIREVFEGLAEIGNDGSIFVEESVSGRTMQFDKKGNLIWKYTNNEGKNNNLYRLNWSRIIKDIDQEFYKKLGKLNCDES